MAVSKLAKDLIPRVTIVFGGTHPTIMPEETLNNETVDAVCIGEGEVTFNEYLNALDKVMVLKEFGTNAMAA
jgi:radical SAM superfamily enzyme YgiQ (UPF0313 family)